jgi:predicted metal-dependent phosphoesterase TrpH
MIYDLHVHTSASDGFYSPEKVIEKASIPGLAGIAITDHDTVDGLQAALNFAMKNKYRINVVPGIEMNTELDGEEIHILGYFIDYKSKRLDERLGELKNSRFARACKMINKLKNLGINIDIEEVQKMARGNLIGRPHIARAMMNKGYVLSIKEAFEKYISKGQPAYVPRYKFLPQEAIALIKEVGGISVLAHPGLIKNTNKLNSILTMGIEGVEVLYPEHSQDQITKYTEFCINNNLLITGGSDFHGFEREKSRNKLGCCGVDEIQMNQIIEYYRKV